MLEEDHVSDCDSENDSKAKDGKEANEGKEAKLNPWTGGTLPDLLIEADNVNDCDSENDSKAKKGKEAKFNPWKTGTLPDLPMNEIDIRGNSKRKTKISSIAEMQLVPRRNSMYSRSDLKFNEGEEKKKEFFSGGAKCRRHNGKRKMPSKFTPKIFL